MLSISVVATKGSYVNKNEQTVHTVRTICGKQIVVNNVELWESLKAFDKVCFLVTPINYEKDGKKVSITIYELVSIIP